MLSIRQAVILYTKRRREFYLEYFHEFRLVIQWLGIREESPPPLPELKWFQGNYEVQELAKLLGTTQAHILSILEDIT